LATLQLEKQGQIMTWEWVALILGVVLLIVLLFSFIAWTQMRTKMFEAVPKTLPDMMARTEKKEDASP
jgi:hypothetical protein